jgi:redox-sensitive bicupin YhaK (pirin superfamily)
MNWHPKGERSVEILVGDSKMNTRTLVQIIPSIPTSDGAGVKLRRSLGGQRGLYVDPFLMLDEFYSDDPHDYIAGFPAHPHRGFETVTYMLDGHMRHEDHLGNRGDLGPGDVQWMTAARGIIHSEMPQQSEGRMRGFPAVAQPAVEGKNEGRSLSRYSQRPRSRA